MIHKRTRLLALTAAGWLSLFLVFAPLFFNELTGRPTRVDISRGLEFYQNGQYEEAVREFTLLLDSSPSREDLLKIHAVLSLSYFALADSIKAASHIDKMFEIDANSRPFQEWYSTGYLQLFEITKSGFIARLDESMKAHEAETKDKAHSVPQVKEKAASSKGAMKKGKSRIWLIGGLVLGGGAAALLLVNKKEVTPQATIAVGSIQVNSSPAGAIIYLDNKDTGHRTNSIIANVAPGEHRVRLEMEGYHKYEESIEVKSGATSTVNASLVKHTIKITAPAGNAGWKIGDTVEIKWTSSESGAASHVSMTSQVDLPTCTRRYGGSFPRRSAPKIRPTLSQASENYGRTYAGRSSSSSPAHDSLAIGVQSPVETSERYASEGRRAPLSLNRTLSNITAWLPLPEIISSVRISLWKSGTESYVIAEKANNSGTFNWRIDSTVPEGDGYRIRVSCVDAPTVYGESIGEVEIRRSILLKFQVDKLNISVPEGERTAFGVRTTSRPETFIIASVRRVSGDNCIRIVSKKNLVFTPQNWQKYQRVEIEALSDDDAADGKTILGIGGSGAKRKDLNVIVKDDETLEFVLERDKIIVDEGKTASTRIKLSANPGVDKYLVSIKKASGDDNITIKAGEKLVFNEANWDSNKSVVFQASQDVDTINGEAAFSINAYGMESKTITVKENDDDYSGPDINLKVDGKNVDNGGLFHFGIVSVDKRKDVIVKIENLGKGPLKLAHKKIVIEGPDSEHFIIKTQPSSVVNPGEYTPFVVQFSPEAVGPRTALIKIESNDPDETPYELNLNGVGKGTAKISVKVNSIEIPTGATVDINNVAPGSSRELQFEIINKGQGDLTLKNLPLILAGENKSEYSITEQPSSPIAPGGKTTFTIRFSPLTPGEKNGSVSILNNDIDKSPYVINLRGGGGFTLRIDFDNVPEKGNSIPGTGIAYLFDNDGVGIDTKVTDSAGNVEFKCLLPATYKYKFDVSRPGGRETWTRDISYTLSSDSSLVKVRDLPFYTEAWLENPSTGTKIDWSSELPIGTTVRVLIKVRSKNSGSLTAFGTINFGVYGEYHVDQYIPTKPIPGNSEIILDTTYTFNEIGQQFFCGSVEENESRAVVWDVIPFMTDRYVTIRN